MIKKIKSKVRSLLNQLDKTEILTQDILAMQQLLKIFPEGTFLPHTSWSLSPRQVLHMYNEMLLGGKRNVVEFGTGFSTICLAQLIKVKQWDGHIYSVENSPEWVSTFNGFLAELGLESYVTIITAPIVEVSKELSYKDQALWYDVQFLQKAFSTIPKIDLVVVDGPFGGSTPFARYTALPFIRPYLNEDFVVFLDDTKRPQESEISEAWVKLIGGKVFKHNVYHVIKPSRQAFDLAPYRA